MVIRNDASLRGKCKAIAKKHGVMAQEVTCIVLSISHSILLKSSYSMKLMNACPRKQYRSDQQMFQLV